MKFGFGVLRLSSMDFWKMTPREIQSAFEAVFGAQHQAMQRSALAGLMRTYPDVRNAPEESKNG